MGAHVKKNQNKLESKITEYLGKKSIRLPQNDNGELSAAYISMTAAAVLAALVLTVFELSRIPGLIIAIAADAACSYDIVRRVISAAAEHRPILSELCVLLAAVLVLASGKFAAALVVIALFRCACIFRAAAENRYARTISGFSSVVASKVRVLTEEGEKEISPKAVEPGMLICVEAGEIIPLDGVITEGITSVDYSCYTGSGESFDVSVGSRVVSGSLNLSNKITVKVTGEHSGSTASELLYLLDKAADYKSDAEIAAGILSKYFPALAALIALITGIVCAVNGQLETGIAKAANILLLASSGCYCAMSLAYLCAMVKLAGSGIFVKRADMLDTAAAAKTAVFSNKGTITRGKYSVIDQVPTGMTEYELLSVAATAESVFNDPVAKAVCAACSSINTDGIRVEKLEEEPGRGIHVFIGDSQVVIGTADYLAEHGVLFNVSNRPGIVLHVAVNSRYCGYLVVADSIRSRTFETIDTLHLHGVKNIVMLTSESRLVAKKTASSLNFDMIKPELTTEGKLSAIQYLMNRKPPKSTLIYVGDAANDGLIMDKVDLAVGLDMLKKYDNISDVDVALLGSDIEGVSHFCVTSQRTYSTALGILGIPLLLKLIFIVVSLLGTLPAVAAAVLDLVVFAGCYFFAARLLR